MKHSRVSRHPPLNTHCPSTNLSTLYTFSFKLALVCFTDFLCTSNLSIPLEIPFDQHLAAETTPVTYTRITYTQFIPHKIRTRSTHAQSVHGHQYSFNDHVGIAKEGVVEYTLLSGTLSFLLMFFSTFLLAHFTLSSCNISLRRHRNQTDPLFSTVPQAEVD